jgi:hypothetical protein
MIMVDVRTMEDAWSCLRTVCNDRLGISGAKPSGSTTSFSCTEQHDVHMSSV